jgi:exodeoxyribonuclease-3
MRLVSWNVNGIRAAAKKTFFSYLENEAPDVLCIQETKAHPEQLDETLLTPPEYYTYWNSAERKGYSGVATFTKVRPQAVASGTEILPMDTEGRILRTDFQDFALYNIYFPNGGRSAERLRFKLEFYDRILDHFEEERKKNTPLVICGDVNTAHNEIDLKNPKQNERNSGFMPIERAWLDRITELGYIDTFRHFHPDAVDHYSWWDMRTRARDRNAGWRIDYFIVTPDVLPRCRDASIQMEVTGSDHAPVILDLKQQ